MVYFSKEKDADAMMFPGIPTQEQKERIHERVRLDLQWKAYAAAYDELVKAGKAPDIIINDDLSIAGERT